MAVQRGPEGTIIAGRAMQNIVQQQKAARSAGCVSAEVGWKVKAELWEVDCCDCRARSGTAGH